MAGKVMKSYFENMKNITLVPDVVTIKSSMKEDNVAQLEKLADEILA